VRVASALRGHAGARRATDQFCVKLLILREAPSPRPLPGITRFSTLKILGVTVTNTLSIQTVIKSYSQTLHALRILRSHCMSATIIQHVFQAVVIAKLTYASQCWSGFTSASDILYIV